MNKYIVYVKEVHTIQIEVEASSKEEAVQEAANSNGVWIDDSMEFFDCLDYSEWEAELVV
jgi:hypothetical protein